MKFCPRCQHLLPDNDETLCPRDGTMANVVETPPLDSILDNYRLLGLLGEGGMGSIYRASHLTLQKQFALKFLHPSLSSHPQLIERFLREARAANVVSHEHIVKIYDIQNSKTGLVYLVMEFLEGESLRQYLLRVPQLDLVTFCTLASQISSALHAAHANGVIHRDIKPENIFLKNAERPFAVLLDFGIARLQKKLSSMGITKPGTILGTPKYMAPEQFYGDNLDRRSDIYSLGMTFFEMLCGSVPFTGPSVADFVRQHSNEALPKPRSLRSDLPIRLEELLLQMTAKDPNERPSSLREVMGVFAELQSERRPLAISTPAPHPKKPWLLVLAVALLVLIGGGIALWPRPTIPPMQQHTQRAEALLEKQHSDDALLAESLRDLGILQQLDPALLRTALRSDNDTIAAQAIQLLQAQSNPRTCAFVESLFETLRTDRQLQLASVCRDNPKHREQLEVLFRKDPAQFEVALALAAQKDPAAIEALSRQKGKTPSDEERRLEVLFSQQPQDIGPQLESLLLSGTNDTSLRAARFLLRQQNPSARAWLESNLRDTNVLLILAEARLASAEGPLQARLQSKDPVERRLALLGLSFYKKPSIDNLVVLFDDVDSRVRYAAARLFLLRQEPHAQP